MHRVLSNLHVWGIQVHLTERFLFWRMYLFEVVEGKWILNYEPKHKKPIEEFLRPQGRFKHLFKKGNEDLIAQIQAEVDHRWEDLLKKAK